MIQRIQSVYLLLMAICLVFVFVLPLASYEMPDLSETLWLTHASDHYKDAVNVIGMWPGVILTSLLCAITLLSLLSFRQRKKQMGLGRLMYLLIVGLVAANYFFVQNNMPVSENKDAAVVYGIAFFLPVAALALNFLANRAIRSDEELVKSVDRLR